MKPTDDELEAMAARLEAEADDRQGKERDTMTLEDEAAAMLRACKTDPAPDHSDWNAAIEAAIVNLKTYSPRKEDAGPEYDIGYVAGYRTALNRVSALKKGPPQWLTQT